MRLRALVSRILPAGAMRRLRAVLGRSVPASAGYEVIDSRASQVEHPGWLDAAVAARQRAAFATVLAALRLGEPRADFAALAEALRCTGLSRSQIFEVGCGSGWNGEVLETLLGHPVRYAGLDYSPAMVALARGDYPGWPFLVGDAVSLPLADAAVDVLISGTVLMHVGAYSEAIRESRRVARRWCIFHTVPVLQERPTAILRKEAYGQPVIEVILNEGELLCLFAANGLALRRTLPSLPYDLVAVLGEPTTCKTYVCEVV